MKIFPFPDLDACRAELERDLLYERIPAEDRLPAVQKAWETGVRAARDTMERYPGMGIVEIARAEGLTLEWVVRDQVAGRMRYFSEYCSGRGTIFLYTGFIGLWAQDNDMDPEEACELILAHEIFHHLECGRLGMTSRQYRVPRLRIGGLALGKAGIRALSEIGAHGFARTFYEECHQGIRTSGL